MVGDPTSDRRFRALYDAHGADVYRYFRRRADDPLDCTADTFLVAWRRIDDVPDGEAALRWLYGVARNVLLNHRRSSRRLRHLRAKISGTTVDPVDGPETVVVQRAEDAHLIEALRRLPHTDQEVLLLATWEELPHAAIGELLGCSAHAVDQRVHRAIKKLAREMRRAGHGHVAGTTPAIESRGEAR